MTHINHEAARVAAKDAIGETAINTLETAGLIPISKAELLALATTPNRVLEPVRLTAMPRLGLRWYNLESEFEILESRAADDTVDAQVREALIATNFGALWGAGVGVELNALGEIVRVWTIE